MRCRDSRYVAGLHEGGERPRGLGFDLQAPVEDQDVPARLRGWVREVQHPEPHRQACWKRDARRREGFHHVRHGEIAAGAGVATMPPYRVMRTFFSGSKMGGLCVGAYSCSLACIFAFVYGREYYKVGQYCTHFGSERDTPHPCPPLTPSVDVFRGKLCPDRDVNRPGHGARVHCRHRKQ